MSYPQASVAGAQLLDNKAFSGGAVELEGDAKLNLDQTLLAGNYAEEFGGGIHSVGWSTVRLVDSRVINNTADYMGGGMAVDVDATLTLGRDVSISGNRADYGWGGGIALFGGNFNITSVRQAVYNNTALYEDDLSVTSNRIVVLGDTHISGYANRVADNEGLLQISVRLEGYHGLPGEGVIAQALLDDETVLATNQSDANGTVHLRFKVARPPGQYNISVIIQDYVDVPAANFTLEVRACGRGEVTPSPDACQRCQQGFYSFDGQQAVCKPCPMNANCTGGDVILPLSGFWRSSASSVQVHRLVACCSARHSEAHNCQ